MGDVVDGNFETTGDIPVEIIVDEAADLQTAVVVGYDADGKFHMFSSTGDSAQILLMLAMAKRRLMLDVHE